MIQTIREWFNRNELRAYPLTEEAGRVSASGNILPENVLADCALSYPAAAGAYAFIASFFVSPGLLSIVIAAGDDLDSTDVTPLASVTLRQPIVAQQVVSVSPLLPGVGGWLVFGAISSTPAPWSAVFTTPRGSQLLPRCATPYAPPPVTSVAKLQASSTLSGMVLLRAGAGVVLEAAINTATEDRRRLIDGELRDAVVISIDGEVDTTDLAGPCGARPEQGTCESRLIQTINGVRPDCDGNITIEFVGIEGLSTGTVYDEDGVPVGVQVDYPLGLVDICSTVDEKNSLRSTADLCGNEIPVGWTPPEPPEPVVPDPEPEPEPGDPDPRYTTPWIELFDEGPTNFTELVAGYWNVVDSVYEADTRTGGGFVTAVNTRTRSTGATTEIAMWTGSEVDVHRAYLLFDYDSSRAYWYLSIEPANNRIVLGQRTGAGFFTRVTYGYSFTFETFVNVGVTVRDTSGYRGKFTVTVNGNAVGSPYSTSDQLRDGCIGFASSSGVARIGAVAVYEQLPSFIKNRPYLRPTETPTADGPVVVPNLTGWYDHGEFLEWTSDDSYFQVNILQGELLKSYYINTPSFEITTDLFESDPLELELPYQWRVRSLSSDGWSQWSGPYETFRVT
jgi:hypothetical protein